MALPDFTGQNIQNTYQRLLQIGEGGIVFDGTGSLPPILQVTASNAISASIEITKEVSSSFADTAAALVMQPSINVTNITASSNITVASSGSFNQLVVTGSSSTSSPNLRAINISGSTVDSSIYRLRGVGVSGNFITYDNGPIVGYPATETLKLKGTSITLDGNAIVNGNITASGNISSSARINATNLVLTANSSGGILTHTIGTFSYNIINRLGSVFRFGDTNLTTQITGSFVQLVSPNQIHFDSDQIRIRNREATVAVAQIHTDEQLLDFDLSNAPLKSVRFIGNISASGDVSSSGVITTAELKGSGTTTGFETSGYLSSSNLIVDGPITSSGEISASGNVYGFRYFLEDGAQGLALSSDVVMVGDVGNRLQTNAPSINFANGDITASGDISSSGNLIGRELIASFADTIRLSEQGGAGNFVIDDGADGNVSVLNILANNVTTPGMFQAAGVKSTTHITSSGNISASGTIYGGGLNINGSSITFNDNDISDVGTIQVDNVAADTNGDNKISFESDKIDTRLEDTSIIEATETKVRILRESSGNGILEITGNSIR
jgi:hypothetical protein